MKLLSQPCYLLTLLFALMTTNVNGQDDTKVGLLSISDITPELGSTIQIQLPYQPTEESKPIYYFGVGNKSFAYDINLSKDLSADIFVPDSVDVIAFHVPNNQGEYDNNNGEGYLFNIYEGSSQKIENEDYNFIKPGSDIAMNYFKSQNESLLELDIDRKELYKGIKSDYLSNSSGFDHSLAQLLLEASRNKDAEFQQLIAKQIIKEEQIIDLANLEDFYFYNGKREEANLVLDLMKEKYPTSKELLSKKVRALQDKRDRNEFEATVRNIKQNFETEKNDLFNNTVSNFYKQSRQYDEYLRYQDKVKNPISKSNNFNSLAWKISTSGGGEISFAEQLSQKAIHLLEDEKETKSSKFPLMTTSNYEQLLDNYLRKYNETFALAKYLQNDLESATKSQEIAAANFDQVHYNETYFFYLQQANNHQTIADVGEIMLANGEMTSDMLDVLKDSYQKVYPNRNNLDQKIQAFEVQAKERLKGELASELIDRRPPDFVLNDLEGNEIQLEDYIGKVVILDFWATWCGPCKDSFPAMQELVNEFKNDDSVAFLFINTFEGSSASRVEKFMNKNNYTFPVVLDQKKGNTYDATSSFGIDAIPTKIYVGKDGNVKYLATGYGGANKTKLEAEVLIELLKGEN